MPPGSTYLPWASMTCWAPMASKAPWLARATTFSPCTATSNDRTVYSFATRPFFTNKSYITVGSPLVINGVSLLETELGNGQTHHVLVINCESPPGPEIERRHHPSDTGTEVGPYPMADFLAMEDRREHRQHRFDQHPRIPSPTRTDFHVGGVPGLGMEPRIGQDDHLLIKLSNQQVKMRVVDVGGDAALGTNPAPLIQDETEFAADNPAMIALPLLADLGGATPFPHGVDQLDPIAVSNAQHGWGSQKAHGPRGVGLEEP